jgi:phage-related minor tail protein
MVGENSSAVADREALLDRTLEKTGKVAADVRRASHDLLVVNTVLEQELPEEVQVGEVAQAIAHTGELEKKLARSAEMLAQVNAALAKEIAKRVEVTEQLDQSQALVEKLSGSPDGPNESHRRST